ncbi:MAG: serine/threonine protein kinase, partial [Thermoleophilaceae bacterium]|nr:serine/threonine protein kinase [Thermoleophilaceae bacterium]
MPEIDVGSEIAGHRLEEIIGRGGMGVVYRARDLTLDRVVALKVIAPEFAELPEFRDRFKRESRQAASIRHPNVISIYRAGEEGALLFITMDYVEGTDLKTFIGVRGRLDPRLAAEVVAQVAAGLEAAHTRGLVHRDVKPANVLIENQRQAYLTDFGLTKPAAPGSAFTKTGMVVGTTDYLAPEQIQGDKLDARVDVYALGCVLYESLTGFVPYPRENPAATMWAHMSDPPPSVLERAPDVPVEFDQVVRRAMAKDPNQRFLSAEAMGQALTAAASGVEPRESGVSLPQTVAATGLDRRDTEGATQAADRRPTAPATSANGEGQGPPPDDGVQGPASTPPAPPARPTQAGRGQRDTAPTARQRRNPRLLIGLAVLGVALAVAGVALLAGGGDDGSDDLSGQSVAVPVAAALPKDLAWREIRDAPFARQYA